MWIRAGGGTRYLMLANRAESMKKYGYTCSAATQTRSGLVTNALSYIPVTPHSSVVGTAEKASSCLSICLPCSASSKCQMNSLPKAFFVPIHTNPPLPLPASTFVAPSSSSSTLAWRGEMTVAVECFALATFQPLHRKDAILFHWVSTVTALTRTPALAREKGGYHIHPSRRARPTRWLV